MANPVPPPIIKIKPRTSLRRGAAALLLASMAAIVPLGLVLLLVFSLGLTGGCVRASIHSQIEEFAGLALVLAGATLLLGLPTWLFLRLTERESGTSYLMAGLSEGLLCAFYVGYSGAGALRLDQAIGFGVLSLAGGGIAWTFWRIAREPNGPC